MCASVCCAFVSVCVCDSMCSGFLPVLGRQGVRLYVRVWLCVFSPVRHRRQPEIWKKTLKVRRCQRGVGLARITVRSLYSVARSKAIDSKLLAKGGHL